MYFDQINRMGGYRGVFGNNEKKNRYWGCILLIIILTIPALLMWLGSFFN